MGKIDSVLNKVSGTLEELEIANEWAKLLRTKGELLIRAMQFLQRGNYEDKAAEALARVAEIDQALGIFKSNIK